ncbi:leucine-rich repeat protein [Paludibacteraceae bacterium OttesenSCG-928-F17]|nr:leucine-rich repeat protein [Paludibacteraceae bacterium OttesenSCG-928-F17]
MKTKLLLLLTTVLWLTSAQVQAQSGTTGGLTWIISNDTLTISGTGPMPDYPSNAPWYSDPSFIKTVVIESGVTSIGDGAFWGCSSLSSIEIPNSITSIGNLAFRDCSSLTSIEIPNSVTAIGNGTFWGCSSLFSIEIPNGVTSIGNYTFKDCISLSSIEIPSSVTSIGYGAFDGCISLSSVGIPNSVTTIGDYAFRDCSSLTFIEIPNSVTTIGDGTFWGCSSLTSIEIPNSVITIGSGAFSDCISLTSIEIPKSVTTIGSLVFIGCSKLENVIMLNTTPSAVSLGTGVFAGVTTSEVTLLVPASAISVYETEDVWKDFNIVAGYMLEAISNNKEYGSVSGSRNTLYPYGESVTITATPEDACKFTGWIINEEVISTDNPYTFSVTEDIALTANFISTDATLAELTASAGVLSPAFSNTVTEYSVDVENTITEIIFTATPSDKNATIQGDGTHSLTVGENTFDIVVTADDGETTKTYTITVTRSENTTSITEAAVKDMDIYPNPVMDRLYIDTPAAVQDVAIYNTDGAIVRQQTNASSINTASWKQGVYFLKITTIEGSITKKIVKQ